MKTLVVLGLIASVLLIVAPARADETCQSPFLPKVTGQEDYIYVWTLGVKGVADGNDSLVTVDVDPKSPGYGKIVHRAPVPGQHEAHHAGFTDDRRHLWMGGLDDSRIFVFDVATDPASPRLVSTIDDFVEKTGGVVGPHTFYALPGRMLISGLSNAKDFGGRTALAEYNNDGKFIRTIWMPDWAEYGYDVRVGRHFKVFTNARCTIVDPKHFDPKSFVDIEGDACLIPPNSFALAETVEYFEIPRDVIAVCVGKSTYARCGIIVNVTPLEPEWRGRVTIEISNTTPLPAKVYAGEGIAQILFLYGGSSELSEYLDFARRHARMKVFTVLGTTEEKLALYERMEALAKELLPKEAKAHVLGRTVLIDYGVESLVDGQIRSLGVATVAIGLLMILLFRSLRMGLIVMLPNIAPVVMLFGIMGWLQ